MQTTTLEQYFSGSYFSARQRFREASSRAGFSQRAYRLNTSRAEDLSIDVAVLGRDGDPAFMISSGIHGIEGFFGSAVQLALLETLGKSGSEAPSTRGIRYVLVHAINPFGFANLRRANEDNVDLNRNFILPGEAYEGSPAGYARMDGFFNPPSPPPKFDMFRFKILGAILRMGLQPLKEAVAAGQYEFPRGIFFGGHGSCESTRIVQENAASWLGSADQILHLDLHTGLGQSGACKLLIKEPDPRDELCWFTDAFGGDVVEAPGKGNRTSYPVKGAFGVWMQHRFRNADYRFATAEFGTHNLVRILQGLRAENRASHFTAESSSSLRHARDELLECFCPASSSWRSSVVSLALELIRRGARALRSG